MDATQDLPDLLADDTLIGDNPTETAPALDALGNPVGEAESAPDADAAPTPRVITLPPRNANALPALRDDLLRDGKFGAVPAPAADGTTPFAYYRRPAGPRGDRRPISVIVGGLGINPTLTRRAITELPPEVTLSFAAHAPNLQDWIVEARQAGHEALLELPMESAGFDVSEPGANRALRADASVAANADNLLRQLSRAQGYAGVVNYNGDRVLPRSDLMAPVLSELDRAGLAFFSDGSVDAPSLPALATATGLPYAQSFGLIDPSPDSTVIAARLSTLTQQAKAGDAALGVGFAYPQTIDALKGWSATLANEDLVLVPASAAAQ